MTDNKVTKLPTPPEPMTMVERAIAQGATIEVIEKVMAMQERYEANEARKAFNRAIAEFKKNPPEILKNTEVSFGSGKTSYKYEDLADVFAAVDPALAAHGLWARYKMKSEGPLITVTCVLGHNDGHSEEPASLSAAPDTSGNKNAVQAIGSTASYLQRYTLKAALGMAAARDDDGRRSGAKVLTPEHVDKINELLLAEPGIVVEKFLEKAGAPSVSDIEEVKFDSCVRYLKAQAEAIAKKKASKK